ncbi:hypothetical protein Xcel_1745 [Xylanimonas cellulosilytica DSM 15894]|uniref:Uncharacterized protein n=1 Tax=Xylanimonas cellulosilytica (strain DSM 15894 / JCM 12276 / CECT 5975 / KCTC 9989 / LMG 20990 / NBRC 107835 / XIL07) TaxID=446471 RepID=D1BSS6_XYLCX|nr:hypothetical protein [Xylanimonas cellulosilytica]ACZ30768.1 hypothetical protein Xcel_1745 [Xylanimonas cellulosilytica DSM 15894]
MSQTVDTGATPSSPAVDSGAVWQRVAWRTAVGLGLVALVLPIVEVVARAIGAELPMTVRPAVMLGISLVWIVVVAARRWTPAVPTLMAAGLVQALAGAVLALGTTWIFDGLPGGPLVRPTQLLVALAAGALWGLVCGAMALALQNARKGLHPTRGDL